MNIIGTEVPQAHLVLRRRADDARDLPVLRRHEHDATGMLGGIAETCAVASTATPEIGDSAVQTLAIYRMDDCSRRAYRQNHPEGDQRQVAVEHDRAIDAGQRPDLFDHAFNFREQRSAEEAAERRRPRSRRSRIG